MAGLMAKPQKPQKPKKLIKPGVVSHGRGRQKHELVNITEEKDPRTGKTIITVERTKPGNSHN